MLLFLQMSDWLWIKTPLQSSSKRFRIAVFSFFRIVQCMVTCSSNIVFRTTYKWTTNDHWWTGKQDKGSVGGPVAKASAITQRISSGWGVEWPSGWASRILISRDQGPRDKGLRDWGPKGWGSRKLKAPKDVIN